MTVYRIAPVTVKDARAWIAETHRHLPKLQGALFAVAVEWAGFRVGVATVGHPARVWQGTGRVVVSRCAVLDNLPGVVGRDGTEHASPACTMLYRRCVEAARALGYREIWTYTLDHESGQTLRAAGFEFKGLSRDSSEWEITRPGRTPVETGPKKRWARAL